MASGGISDLQMVLDRAFWKMVYTIIGKSIETLPNIPDLMWEETGHNFGEEIRDSWGKTGTLFWQK